MFLGIVSIFPLDVALDSLRVDSKCLCHSIMHKISQSIGL